MKKKAEMTFNSLVYAILAIVVLVVIIGVFFLLTKGPFKNIWSIEEDAGNQNTNAWDNLVGALIKCKQEEPPKCVSGFKQVCTEGKWEKTQDAC